LFGVPRLRGRLKAEIQTGAGCGNIRPTEMILGFFYRGTRGSAMRKSICVPVVNFKLLALVEKKVRGGGKARCHAIETSSNQEAPCEFSFSNHPCSILPLI